MPCCDFVKINLTCSVTLLDVNDNKPELTVESTCVNITEFHEPRQPISLVRATDRDDPKTPNGQVTLTLKQSIKI